LVLVPKSNRRIPSISSINRILRNSGMLHPSETEVPVIPHTSTGISPAQAKTSSANQEPEMFQRLDGKFSTGISSSSSSISFKNRCRPSGCGCREIIDLFKLKFSDFVNRSSSSALRQILIPRHVPKLAEAQKVSAFQVSFSEQLNYYGVSPFWHPTNQNQFVSFYATPYDLSLHQKSISGSQVEHVSQNVSFRLVKPARRLKSFTIEEILKTDTKLSK